MLTLARLQLRPNHNAGKYDFSDPIAPIVSHNTGYTIAYRVTSLWQDHSAPMPPQQVGGRMTSLERPARFVDRKIVLADKERPT
jgi:hypothetical protein